MRGPGYNSILDRHCGRSFGFALLQSETHKKEMLASVYSKEAPDGGKTKGTSHYPPWGTCTLELHVSTLLFILSTCPPPPTERAALPPASLAQSFSALPLSLPSFRSLSYLISLGISLKTLLSHSVCVSIPQDQRVISELQLQEEEEEELNEERMQTFLKSRVSSYPRASPGQPL